MGILAVLEPAVFGQVVGHDIPVVDGLEVVHPAPRLLLRKEWGTVSLAGLRRGYRPDQER